jgi:hypothetical protein
MGSRHAQHAQAGYEGGEERRAVSLCGAQGIELFELIAK